MFADVRTKKKKKAAYNAFYEDVLTLFFSTSRVTRSEMRQTKLQCKQSAIAPRGETNYPHSNKKSWDAAHNINLKTNRKKGRKFFFFFLLLFYTAPHLFRNLTLKKHFNMFVLKSNVADLSQALVFRFTGKLNIKIKWYWVPLVNTRALDRGKRLEQRTD